MNKTLLVAIASVASTNLATANSPIHMSFANTYAATVMKVIARRTGVNIVFVGKEIPKISLDITVENADEAIRAAVSAAGMCYRKVYGAYVVASADGMKQALQPYSVKVQYPVEPGIADRILKTVQTSFPDATVTVTGDKLCFTGIPDDVKESKALVEELRVRETLLAPTTDLVAVGHSNPSDISKTISALWPDLKVATAGDEKGGAISLLGPIGEVGLAKEFATKLDTAVQNRPQAAFQVYEIKYLSATKLEAFIKGAMPDVESFIAPESYSPKRATFNPLTSAISGGAGGSSSGGSGGGGASPGGSSGGSSSSSTGGAAGSLEEPDARARRLVLHGSAARLASAVVLLDSIDVKPQQVFVEVKVVETSPSFEDNEGLAWNWSPLQFLEAPAGAAIANVSANTVPAQVGKFSKAPLSFGAVLSAQIVSGEAKILANPKLGVIDNDGASIFIGDTVNVPTSSSSLSGTTTSFVSFPVGIILLIHPRINADGNITMHVNPVISTITGANGNFPQTSSREAETTMIVKDGETIVMGGLLQETLTKTVTEVPLLSKLPILGALFRNSSTSKSRKDVIITITTHIVKETSNSK